MRVIREFLLLCFLAIASGEKNFQLFQELMESYSPQSELSKLSWDTYTGFEKDLRSLPPTTTVKLHPYFEKMNRGRMNYENAMNSIVSVCTVSKITLPQILKNMDLNKVNKSLKRFKDAFEDSNSNLTTLLEYMSSAYESISAFKLEPEKPTKHRFVITDLKDGTATFEIEGSALQSSALQSADGFNSFNDLLKSVCKTGLPNPNKITFEISKKGPREVISEKINASKNELPRTIHQLNSLVNITSDKLEAFVESVEPPTPSDIENILARCKEFNAHRGV